MTTRMVFKVTGFRAILKSPGVAADVMRRARAIASASGPGFVAAQNPNPRVRARASVTPMTPEATIANQRDNTMVNHLDAGR